MSESGIDAGLCNSCQHCHRIRTQRGSVFYRCLRSESDGRFPRYPRLPVLSCPGYERVLEGKES